MPCRRNPEGSASQICVESAPKGLRAVYLVETKSEQDASELAALFDHFHPMLESIQLSKGKLTSYAVQLHSQDQSVLQEIEDLLRKNYGFVILHRSFEQLIYDIVCELCRDSGSRLLPMPKCDICGKPEPFPETRVTFLDDQNTSLATRIYCAACTAASAGRSNKEFIVSLLEADRSDFGALRHMNLVRSRSSKKRLAFRIKCDAEHQFAVR